MFLIVAAALFALLALANVHLARIVHLLRKLVTIQAEANALSAAKPVRPDR